MDAGIVIERPLPRRSEPAPLPRIRRLDTDPVARRLALTHTIGDLEAIARRRAPRAGYDDVTGGADGEVRFGRARDAYRRVEYQPQPLRGVSSVDPSTRILGRPSSLPLMLAPNGLTRMMQHGQPAVARAAKKAGNPSALSTMGTTSPARDAPGGEDWFQLYPWRERAECEQLVAAAQDAGFGTLVLTVDTHVPRSRSRDVRNGLIIPPARTVADVSGHPAWWINLPTARLLEFAVVRSSEGTMADLVARMLDPAPHMTDLPWPRRERSGPCVANGVLSVDAACRIADARADPVTISNHGGHRLDRAPTPLELLPVVAAAVGDRVELDVDTGITDGGDFAAAVGPRVRTPLVGRAYLYRRTAEVQRGVGYAVAILAGQLVRTMELVGAQSPDKLHERVALRGERRAA